MRIDRIKLIAEMARRNISQTDLATRCNCSRETISLACRGLRCSDKTAEAIAEVLEIPVKELRNDNNAKVQTANVNWGVREKVFPAQLIDAEITHLIISPLPQGCGYRVGCDISLDESIVKILLELEKKHEQ